MKYAVLLLAIIVSLPLAANEEDVAWPAYGGGSGGGGAAGHGPAGDGVRAAAGRAAARLLWAPLGQDHLP